MRENHIFLSLMRENPIFLSKATHYTQYGRGGVLFPPRSDLTHTQFDRRGVPFPHCDGPLPRVERGRAAARRLQGHAGVV